MAIHALSQTNCSLIVENEKRNTFYSKYIQPKLAECNSAERTILRTAASHSTSMHNAKTDIPVNDLTFTENTKAFEATIDHFSTSMTPEQALASVFSENDSDSISSLTKKQTSALSNLLKNKITIDTPRGQRFFSLTQVFNALAEELEKPRLIFKSHQAIARIIYPDCENLKIIIEMIESSPTLKDLSKQEKESIVRKLTNNDNDWVIEGTLKNKQSTSEQFAKNSIKRLLKNENFTEEEINSCIIGGKPIGLDSYKFSFRVPNELRDENGQIPEDQRHDFLLTPLQKTDTNIQAKKVDFPASLEIIYTLKEKTWQPTGFRKNCHEINYSYLTSLKKPLFLNERIDEREKRKQYLTERSQGRSWFSNKPIRAQGQFIDFYNTYQKSIGSKNRLKNEWKHTLYKPDASAQIPFISYIDLVTELEDLTNDLLPIWQKKHGFSEANKIFKERLNYLNIAYRCYCNDPQYSKISIEALSGKFQQCVNNLLLSQIKAEPNDQEKIAMFNTWLKKDKVNCIKTCYSYWYNLGIEITNRKKPLLDWLQSNQLLAFSYAFKLKEYLIHARQNTLGSENTIEQSVDELLLLEQHITLIDYLKLEEVEQSILQHIDCFSRENLETRKEQLKNHLKEYITSHGRQVNTNENTTLINETQDILRRRSEILNKKISDQEKREKLVLHKSAKRDEIDSFFVDQYEAMNKRLEENDLEQAYIHYKNLSDLEGYQTVKQKIKKDFIFVLPLWIQNKEELDFNNKENNNLIMTAFFFQMMEWAIEENQTEELPRLWRQMHQHALNRTDISSIKELLLENITTLSNFIEKELQKPNPISLPEFTGTLKILFSDQNTNQELSYLIQLDETLEARCKHYECLKTHDQQSLNTLSIKEIEYELGVLLELKQTFQKLFKSPMKSESFNFVFNQEDRLNALLNHAQQLVEKYRKEWRKETDKYGKNKDLYTHLQEICASKSEQLYTNLFIWDKPQKIIEAINDFETKKTNKVLSEEQGIRLNELYRYIVNHSGTNYATSKEYYEKLGDEDNLERQKKVWAALVQKKTEATETDYLLDEFNRLFKKSSKNEIAYVNANKHRIKILYQKALLSLNSTSSFEKENISILSNFIDPIELRKLFKEKKETILNNSEYLKAFLELDNSNEHSSSIIFKEIHNTLCKEHCGITPTCSEILISHLYELKNKNVKFQDLQELSLNILDRLAKGQKTIRRLELILNNVEKFKLFNHHSNHLLLFIQNILDKEGLLKIEKETLSKLTFFLSAQTENRKSFPLFKKLMFEYYKEFKSFPKFMPPPQENLNAILKDLSNMELEKNKEYGESFLIKLRKHIHKINHSYYGKILEGVNQIRLSIKTVSSNIFSWIKEKTPLILLNKYTFFLVAATTSLKAITWYLQQEECLPVEVIDDINLTDSPIVLSVKRHFLETLQKHINKICVFHGKREDMPVEYTCVAEYSAIVPKFLKSYVTNFKRLSNLSTQDSNLENSIIKELNLKNTEKLYDNEAIVIRAYMETLCHYLFKGPHKTTASCIKKLPIDPTKGFGKSVSYLYGLIYNLKKYVCA